MARTDRNPRQRLDPDARRQMILQAAVRIFAQQPYGEVSLGAIAKQAEASPALVYRYFESKERLYLEVANLAIASLQQQQEDALTAMAQDLPVRERIKKLTHVYLDHIAAHPQAWSMPLLVPGSEPAAMAKTRQLARKAYVENLGDMLEVGDSLREDYALWGYFGFVDAACLRWVELGCRNEDRNVVIETILGALEGALGNLDS